MWGSSKVTPETMTAEMLIAEYRELVESMNWDHLEPSENPTLDQDYRNAVAKQNALEAELRKRLLAAEQKGGTTDES